VSAEAVAHVKRGARAARTSAQRRLVAAGIDLDRVSSSADRIRATARLTMNFHPDRRDRHGRTVAEGLLDDGRYRPQSETGISNGGRSAVPGGHRTRWETDLFADVYEDSSDPRPVYGALDLTSDVHGGSPRFGSSFVVLDPECFDRATFCVGDSHVGPTDIGTIDEFTSILAGLVEVCASGDGFGRGLTPERLLDLVESGTDRPSASRDLDHYVEAQVHGTVDLARDVAAIVVDPSFVGSRVEADLRVASERFGFGLVWHEGSEVGPAEIPDHFRGPDIADLARRIVRDDGVVDAATIGRALEAFPFTPPKPAGDPESSHLQQYKKLWHCCLALGGPAAFDATLDRAR